VVEAVAHYHHPRRIPVNGVNTVLVVFWRICWPTNVKQRERGYSRQRSIAVLEETGLAKQLSEWRELAKAAQAPPVVQLVSGSRTL
jgi:hypothetical protein